MRLESRITRLEKEVQAVDEDTRYAHLSDEELDAVLAEKLEALRANFTVEEVDAWIAENLTALTRLKE